jgi:hypothetical protein
MTRAELLAEAEAADREADRLFAIATAGAGARTEAAKAAGEFLPHGASFAYGEGQADNVARASELRRDARALRAAADATPEAQALRASAQSARMLAKHSSKPGAHSAPVTPPLPFAPSPAAGLPSKPKQEPAVDPVEALARRILDA